MEERYQRPKTSKKHGGKENQGIFGTAYGETVKSLKSKTEFRANMSSQKDKFVKKYLNEWANGKTVLS